MNQAPPSPDDFVRRDAGALLAYLLKLGLRFHDAQDVAAETIKRMCEQWGSIESPRAWARTTAFRLAVDGSRKTHVERAKLQTQAAPPTTCPPADDLYMLKEEQRWIIDHIRTLPPRQRNILALHVDGFTNTEIADMLSANARTVASHLRHAKLRLRAALEAEGIHAPSADSPRRGE